MWPLVVSEKRGAMPARNCAKWKVVQAACPTKVGLPNQTGRFKNMMESGVGEQIQPGLRLLGEAGENHGHDITVVTIASTGDHNTGAMNLAGIFSGLQHHGHFCPGGN